MRPAFPGAAGSCPASELMAARSFLRSPLVYLAWHRNMHAGTAVCSVAMRLQVLNTLVALGAPEDILREGKPHIGTDRLVRVLRQFRETLLDLGADVRFGARVDEVLVEDGCATGVRLADGVPPPPLPSEQKKDCLGRVAKLDDGWRHLVRHQAA